MRLSAGKRAAPGFQRRPGHTVILALILALSVAPTLAVESLLRIAVTTTTDNAGLIDVLMPVFESRTGYTTHVVAGGSGRALRLLANGDVDVAITHAGDREMVLIDEGAVVDRLPVMFNDFILVGPTEDPAGVARASGAVAAFRQIAAASAPFISRGDISGTHDRELALWRMAGVTPQGSWYRDAGQGMGQTLDIAGELDAYTLTDRGTWLAYAKTSPLIVLFQGDERLLNVYSVIAANPARHPSANARGAAALSQWLSSREAADLILGLRIDGSPLFIPLLPRAIPQDPPARGGAP